MSHFTKIPLKQFEGTYKEIYIEYYEYCDFLIQKKTLKSSENNYPIIMNIS